MTLVMMFKWDPDRALELIERERVTNFVGVPTQSFDLLESARFAATEGLDAGGADHRGLGHLCAVADDERGHTDRDHAHTAYLE